MNELHVNRVSGNLRLPGHKEGAPPAITAALIASCLALLLCLLATLFGMGADGGWLALPPDYTGFGWAVRILGGVMGLMAFAYLSLIHHRYRNRRGRRSLAGKLLRISLAISVASIVWEIALLALIVMLALVLAYALFADGGL